MADRGKQHSKAATEAKAASHKVKTDKQNGKVVDKTVQAKGEALTRKADLKAAKDAQRGK